MDTSPLSQTAQLQVNPRYPRYATFENAQGALVEALLRAHFPEALQFTGQAGATFNSPVRGPALPSGATGSFNPTTRAISTSTRGNPTTYLEKAPGGGYVGRADFNPTTENVLDQLRTALHEMHHARVYGRDLNSRYRRDPRSDYERAYGRGPTIGEFRRVTQQPPHGEMGLDAIKESNMPSVFAGEPVEELMASVIPAQQMAARGMRTKRGDQILAEFERLARHDPFLRKLVQDWERPELFTLEPQK